MPGFIKKLSEYNLDSLEFIYLIGSYQAKTRVLPKYRFMILARDSALEDRLMSYMKTVFGADFSYYRRDENDKLVFYTNSLELLGFINSITQNNRRIPTDLLSNNEKVNEYLRGFFDQRCALRSYTYNISVSKTPRIRLMAELTKTGSKPLMKDLVCLLNSLGLSPTLVNRRPTQYQIRIWKKRDLKMIIDIPLLSSGQKLDRLKDIYDEWEQIMRDDKGGALGRRILKAEKERQIKINP